MTIRTERLLATPDIFKETKGDAEKVILLISEFQLQYDSVVAPDMAFLTKQREIMGDRYPEAMFIEPILVDEITRDKMLVAMQVNP